MTKANYVKYDINGMIMMTGSCLSEMLEIQATDDLDVIEITSMPLTAVSSDMHYVIDGEFTNRPIMGVTLTGMTLSGVLEGATVTIEETDYTADGTDIELEFTLPGTYPVKIELWPYQTETINVEVTG